MESELPPPPPAASATAPGHGLPPLPPQLPPPEDSHLSTRWGRYARPLGRFLLGVVVLGAINGAIGSDQEPSAEDDLRVGDCVDDAGGPEAESGLVALGGVVSCAEPHSSEVFHVAAGGASNKDDLSDAALDAICLDHFASYVGTPLSESSYAFAVSGPMSNGEYACLIVDNNGEELTGSKQHTGAPVSGSPDEKPFTSLVVGDCLDKEPGVGDDPTDPDFEATFAVPVSVCTEPHPSEVFALVELPNGDTFPAETIEDDSIQLCLAEFEPYVGIDLMDSTLDFFAMFPSPQSWAMDDREVACILTSMSGEPLTGSMKNTGR